MYLMYVDESGDPGNNTTQSKYFCLTGIIVHESHWKQYIDTLVNLRKTLNGVYGLPMRTEIHSAELIRKNAFGIQKHNRLAILRNVIDELAKMNFISVTNIVVDKSQHLQGTDIFEMAWKTLFQRFENTLKYGNFPGNHQNDYGIVYTDATSGKKLTQIMRKMNVYNPIPNSGGTGYRSMKIQRVIEDPSERDSKSSLPIQSCDVCAYFLNQYLNPNSYIKKKSANRYFTRLQPILNLKASITDPLGIVRR